MGIEGRVTDVVNRSQHAAVYRQAIDMGEIGGNVLDVGTGDGSALIKALTWVETEPGLVVASDPNHKIIMDLRNSDSINPIAAKDKLPFADGTFGVTLSSQVIEHIPRKNHIDFVQELVRVTKPDGYVVISTINHDFPYQVKGHTAHVAEYDRAQAEQLMEESRVFGDVQLMVLIGSERFIKGQKQRASYWWLRPVKDIIPKSVFGLALKLLTRGEIKPDLDMKDDFWIKPIQEVGPDEIIGDFVFVIKKSNKQITTEADQAVVKG
jgi:2-polyprenyl-3-methyl-5-hydroxy-6-metoxy-1,4-benzoquinol methylase